MPIIAKMLAPTIEPTMRTIGDRRHAPLTLSVVRVFGTKGDVN